VTHDRRYAIYFVPADDSPLGVFGARLFGRWPDGTPEPDTLAVPEREERTRRVARYGFHATLKAPFALASGCTESGLVDAAAQLAADMNTSSIGPLVVAPEHATVSLQHSGKTNATVVESVSALAARCVVELEPWRAPLDAEARARRKPHQLSEPERGLLETGEVHCTHVRFSCRQMASQRFLSTPDLRAVVVGAIAMAIIVYISNRLVFYPINDWLTWAAFTYPFAFLVTDLVNRRAGSKAALQVVVVGFALGVVLTMIGGDMRIAIASGTAFLVAQSLDVGVFSRLRERAWWVAPGVSSTLGSVVDTCLFFSIAFVGTGLPWPQWAVGDLAVKLAMVLLALLPYRWIVSMIAASSPATASVTGAGTTTSGGAPGNS